MTDHYAILGISKNATDAEIKSAFRKLAKIYHPDKGLNTPEAKAIFEKILRAYTVLIDPVARRRYDYSRDYTQQTSRTQTTSKKTQPKGQKNWTFTEEDLKRRQYYQQHYQTKKKAAEQTVNKKQQKAYSDYKYVLLATPIAVGLLMLIISMFTEQNTSINNQNVLSQNANKNNQPENGYMPFVSFFGNTNTFETNNKLHIENYTGNDAIIVVFTSRNRYLQHSYLRDSYAVEFSKLPDDSIYIKCVLGNKWNNSLKNNENVYGMFDNINQFQNFKLKPVIFNKNHSAEIISLNILTKSTEDSLYISNAANFFAKHD